ncbi:MAG: redoxin domain-containing protein, partial [Phycisphaerales bacterium]
MGLAAKVLFVCLALAASAVACAAQEKVDLKVGDKAPALKLKSTDDKEHSLAQFQGKSAVALVWFLRAGSSGSRVQLSGIQEKLEEIGKHNVQVLGITTSTLEECRDFAKELKLTFPLLSDPDKTVATAYGTLRGGTGPTCERWAFLIVDRGVIKKVEKGEAVADKANLLLEALGDQKTAKGLIYTQEANSAPDVAVQNPPAVQQPAPADSSAPNLAPNTTFTLTFPDLPPTFDELGNPRQDHAMLMRMGGVPLVKGKCYQITFRIRSSELRQPVGVDIQDTNGWKHSGLNKAIRPGSDWTQGKFSFRNQNNMGDTARLDFAFLQPGHIDVADVKIVEIAAVPADRNTPAEVVNPTNLVTNGDFSDVTNGVPTGWGTAGNKNDVDQVLTAEKDADGKPFARVTCTRLEHHGPGNKPMISVYLPKNYDTTNKFPLLVFLEGGTGGIGDQISTPRALAQDMDFICVNMPLFKEAEAVENQRYLFIDDPDAKFAWSVYKKMLARLDETVPNIDPAHRIIGGFSNGGHTTKGIINQSEGEATTYFTAFYFVESGAGLDRFDLLKGKPLLILYGAKNGGAWADHLFKAAIDAGVKAEVYGMPNTGHDFSPEGKAAVRKWLHEIVLGEVRAEEPSDPASAAGQPAPPSPQNRAIQVSVTVSRTPPAIQLSWPTLVS